MLDETAEYLGAGLSDVINLFQPERILIGGWAGLMLGAHILPAVREHAKRYSLRHPAARVTIDMGSLGPDAVTVGAATLPLAAFFTTGGRRTPPGLRRRPRAGRRPWRPAARRRRADRRPHPPADRPPRLRGGPVDPRSGLYRGHWLPT